MQDESVHGGYTVEVVKDQIFGTYTGVVKLDGERIGRVPLMGMLGASREGVIRAAQRFAEVHAENAGPAIPLDVPSAGRAQVDR